MIDFGGKAPAGPRLQITEAYALPGSGIEVLEGTIASPSPQFALSVSEGPNALAGSSLQSGSHWAIALPLAAGAHTLSVSATDTAITTGAAVSTSVEAKGGAGSVYAAAAATLAALSADQIFALAQSGVTTLAATDATFAFNSAQSAAIQSAGLSVAAPANDRVRENLANGTVLVYVYGANGALSKVVTSNTDGTADRRIFGVSGVVNAIAYAGYDVFVDANGAGVQKLFLDARGGEVSTLTFDAHGYSIYVDGQLQLKRTEQSAGGFDVFRYNHPGSVGGFRVRCDRHRIHAGQRRNQRGLFRPRRACRREDHQLGRKLQLQQPRVDGPALRVVFQRRERRLFPGRAILRLREQGRRPRHLRFQLRHRVERHRPRSSMALRRPRRISFSVFTPPKPSTSRRARTTSG